MCVPHETKFSSIEVNLKEEMTDSEAESSPLKNFSLEELRENAVGRALVKQTKAHKMTRNELTELLEPFACGMNYNPQIMRLHPFSPPSTTLGEIRNAIPPHLFKRSPFRAFRYIALDICMALAIFYAGTFIEKSELQPVLRCILWGVYWCFQTMHFTALWVMAHECGHCAVSEWESVD
eukprot:776710_1